MLKNQDTDDEPAFGFPTPSLRLQLDPAALSQSIAESSVFFWCLGRRIVGNAGRKTLNQDADDRC